MQRVLLSPEALAAALAAVRGDLEATAATSWAELVAQGVASSPGALTPGWKDVFDAVAAARIRHRLIATHDDLVHLTDIIVGGGYSVSLVQRRRIDPATGDTLGEDPQVEVVVGAGDLLWPLARRVVPPFEAFRAEPEQVPDEAETQLLDADIAARMAERLAEDPSLTPGEALAGLPGLPPELTELLKSRDTVALLSRVAGPSPDSPEGVALIMWVLGARGLYRTATGDRAGFFRTRPGDVGFRMMWVELGMVDLVAGGAPR
jgi:hypothetical protein